MSSNAQEIKILELFGGIGAIRKAFERVGISHKVVDYVEIDKYAVKSYNAMFNENFEVQDICEWDKNIEVDFILHGSPCQDFSVAGLQAGGDLGSGTRSSLMYETVRIVGKLRPKYVIWENVKNVLSKKHKHNFDRYIDTLNTLGYNSYYQVLNAKDYGIPQNRERVFTISIRKDIDTSVFKFPEKEELKLRLKDILEEEVDEKYYLQKYQLENIKNSNFNQNKSRIQEKEYCDTLCARDWKDPKCVQVGTLDMKGHEQMKRVYGVEGIAPTLTAMQGGNIKPKVMVERIGGIFDKEGEKHQAGSVYNKEGIAPPLDTMQGGYRQPMVNVINATKKGYDTATVGDSINMTYPYSNKKRGRVGHGVAQTLDTGCGQATIVETNKIMVAGNCFPSNHEAGRIVSENGISPTIKENHGTVTSVIKNSYPEYRIRKLTPRECWRLMRV